MGPPVSCRARTAGVELQSFPWVPGTTSSSAGAKLLAQFQVEVRPELTQLQYPTRIFLCNTTIRPMLQLISTFSASVACGVINDDD